MTVFVACFAFFVLPNYPATTKWLTPEERELAQIRLVAGNDAVDEEPHMSHWTAFKEACKDPKTWCFALLYNLLNMVVSRIVHTRSFRNSNNLRAPFPTSSPPS